MEPVKFTFELNEQQLQFKEKLYNDLMKNDNVKVFMLANHVDDRYIYNHCGKINDWSIQVDKCERCVGLDFCTQPMQGHFTNLKVDGFLMEEIVPCRYMKDLQQQIKHKNNYKVMDFPEQLLTIDISKLDLMKESGDYSKVVSSCLDLLESKSKKGLYLCGMPGVGKSYLAAGITNYFAREPRKVAFVNVPKLISDLKMLFSDNNAMDLKLNQIKNVDVLVLDDIGGESITAWSRDEILLPLLDKRMEHKKLTIFTSNYKMDELIERLAVTSNKMREPVAAQRLIDRIKALSCEVFVKGVSRRK